jgi:ADP-ribosyl-[dinitrogen reductase] hydrolase
MARQVASAGVATDGVCAAACFLPATVSSLGRGIFALVTPDDTAAPYLLDFVEVSSTGARIGMTPCPGTSIFPSRRAGWKPDLVADLDVIGAWGAVGVVTLIRAGEPTAPQLDDLRRGIEARGIEWHHAPISDGDIPDADFESCWRNVGTRVRTLLHEGQSVLLHCLGGFGRTGTIAARLLVELGEDPRTAIQRVRSSRPGAIMTEKQKQYVLACRRAPD